jgi:GNAT superfamily N-acetyltransferase
MSLDRTVEGETIPRTDAPNGRASFVVRPAGPEDCETIANLVRELAVYEKLEEYAKATAEDFHRHLFGPRRYAESLIAECGGRPVGFALFFPTFSTFRGQPGMYLEDIFVRPEFRGLGIGKALLATVARLTRERGFGRLDWAVLNWNAPAMGFYQALGARPIDEWTIYRIDDGPLSQLAEHGSADCVAASTVERDRDG